MVQPVPVSPSVICFGVFEADLSVRELRKRGRKIPLQDQPFRVLSLLLQPRRVGQPGDPSRGLWRLRATTTTPFQCCC